MKTPLTFKTTQALKALAFTGALAMGAIAQAQEFPIKGKPIRVVVSSP